MSTKKPRAKAKPEPKLVEEEPYTPTPREADAVKKFAERRKSARKVKVIVKPDGPGSVNISIKHADSVVGTAMLLDAWGTADTDFADALTVQLGNTVADNGEINGRKLNGMLSMVAGIKPEDEIEAMLAAQMAAVHNATMNAALYLNNASMLNQLDTHTNALSKLSRTFAAQVEALKKYRSSGEQSIRVQHVNVTAEQAIVGNVQTGGGGAPQENGGQPHEPRDAEPKTLTYAPGTPVFGNVEALRPALQSTGGQRLDCVPLPRGEGRRA